MKAIKLEAVIDDRHELHLKLPKEVKVGPAEVIVVFEDDSDVSGILQKSPEAKVRSLGEVRRFGQFRGLIQSADDFDAPLPNAFWLGDN
ncbi:hypothetical protein [cf. Phormidesmis sp. LEGE 11477]|uniref:hypothetical protein n=1 Tax=cf. Phormidesmis sp. LEGE 11477 TaxID=1828680 RepID=UPI001880A3F0|nr:hypothetical protein [cf. Phormidesmis sp. LEGE 11477]MBE9061854.1 hypothetical protein [cf. Phormidesmis sp. LEGE 11477]